MDKTTCGLLFLFAPFLTVWAVQTLLSWYFPTQATESSQGSSEKRAKRSYDKLADSQSTSPAAKAGVVTKGSNADNPVYREKLRRQAMECDFEEIEVPKDFDFASSRDEGMATSVQG
jgi:hypothetical protein